MRTDDLRNAKPNTAKITARDPVRIREMFDGYRGLGRLERIREFIVWG